MADAPAQTRLTVDDLLRMGANDERVEIVDGELVFMSPVGFLHARIVAQVFRLLDEFVTAQKLGYVLPDGLIFILEESSDGDICKSRIPDVSFIRKGRIPQDFDVHLPFPGAPDLAVEVISPGESEANLLSKIRDYLATGTEQVWALYPDERELHQYLRDDPKTICVYFGDDGIVVPTLFPGLSIAPADIFSLPELD